MRRQETGEAVVEFTVEAGAIRTHDVRLVQTTGYFDLDGAAIKVGRAFKITAQCPTMRVRRSILFDISTDPLNHSQVGCVIFMPPGMVLVTTPEAQ